MYWAENQLVISLPKLEKAAGNPSLKKAFADHLQVTRTHVKKLEQVFELLGEKIQAKKCDAVEGLAMDGEHIIENTLPGSQARDTGLIMAGLKTENYEITSYNGLIQLASDLGNTGVADILSVIQAEEMEADEILSSLSKNSPKLPSKKTK
jgi:ferritin-like metal-binding protein YciE